MIDGLRIWYKVERLEEVLSNENIDWETPVNIHTGETERRYLAKFKGLKLEVKRGRTNYLIITGSIHKYWHGGKNFSQFNYSDLSNALHSLADNLKIELDKCRVTNIEFGVNVRIEEPPSEIYYDFILHKLRPFQDINNNAKSKRLKGVQCLHSQIAIKCYDKGDQYNMPYSLMRFEVKVLKMQHLKKVGIGNMVASDLLDKEVLRVFGEVLVKVYAEILKAQKVELKRVKGKRLTKKDKELLSEGNSPRYWMKLKEKSKRAYDQKRKRFKVLQKRHSIETDKHNNIIELIEQTVVQLLSVNVKIDANLPRLAVSGEC